METNHTVITKAIFDLLIAFNQNGNSGKELAEYVRSVDDTSYTWWHALFNVLDTELDIGPDIEKWNAEVKAKYQTMNITASDASHQCDIASETNHIVPSSECNTDETQFTYIGSFGRNYKLMSREYIMMATTPAGVNLFMNYIPDDLQGTTFKSVRFIINNTLYVVKENSPNMYVIQPPGQ